MRHLNIMLLILLLAGTASALSRWQRLLAAFDAGYTCGRRAGICLYDPTAARDCAETARLCDEARAGYVR